MNQKQVLLNRIRVCAFVLTESALYLDTHPDDAQALEFYHKHLAMRQQAMEEYSKQYGTLVRTQPHSTEHWDWVDNPCRGRRENKPCFNMKRSCNIR